MSVPMEIVYLIVIQTGWSLRLVHYWRLRMFAIRNERESFLRVRSIIRATRFPVSIPINCNDIILKRIHFRFFIFAPFFFHIIIDTNFLLESIVRKALLTIGRVNFDWRPILSHQVNRSSETRWKFRLRDYPSSSRCEWKINKLYEMFNDLIKRFNDS